MRWFRAMYMTELKRMFSYRIDFWVQFFVSVAVEIAVAYFLWASIYSAESTSQISGYSLSMMILYYVFAAFGGRLVRGNERMIIATDIYDGGITKYLLYPVHYISVIGAFALAFDTVTLLQMAIGLSCMFAMFGVPSGYEFHWMNMLMGTTACFVASIFYFVTYVALDFVAFWADTVWGLSAMFRFIIQFLSGFFIPLELFPKSILRMIYYTPFPYIGAEPIKMFLGRSSWSQWVHSNVVVLLWTIPMVAVMQLLWFRGLKNYSGVGI